MASLYCKYTTYFWFCKRLLQKSKLYVFIIITYYVKVILAISPTDINPLIWLLNHSGIYA